MVRTRRKQQNVKEEVEEEIKDSGDSDFESLAEEISRQLENSLSSDESSSGESDEDEGRQSPKFVIDTTSHRSRPSTSVHHTTSSSDEDEDSEVEDDEHRMQQEIISTKSQKPTLACSLEPDVDPQQMVYMQTNPLLAKPALKHTLLDQMLTGDSQENKLLKKSILTSDFEKKHDVCPYEQSRRQLKKQRKHEREQTKGHGWFDMKSPEMTEELRNDLSVLQMRRILDPKRFYKGPDRKALPNFFQMGRIVEAPADFYSSRVPKKQRKKTLVDELLADAEFRQYNKRKYAEIQDTRRKGRGAYKHMKRLKKKK